MSSHLWNPNESKNNTYIDEGFWVKIAEHLEIIIRDSDLNEFTKQQINEYLSADFPKINMKEYNRNSIKYKWRVTKENDKRQKENEFFIIAPYFNDEIDQDISDYDDMLSSDENIMNRLQKRYTNDDDENDKFVVNDTGSLYDYGTKKSDTNDSTNILDRLQKKYCTDWCDDESYNTHENNYIVDDAMEMVKDKQITCLELDDYMICLDDKSLNKLSTAQLMQRLRANNVPWKGLKHELIERWKHYNINQKTMETLKVDGDDYGKQKQEAEEEYHDSDMELEDEYVLKEMY